jgi:EAL domain-containing protein (putative c-di-GMP-specific phosphodiesterase class I)
MRGSPIAALVGLDIALEMKVIERALASFASFPEGIYVGFNVSPNMVLNGQLEYAFREVPLARVVLEVNEHVSNPRVRRDLESAAADAARRPAHFRRRHR